MKKNNEVRYEYLVEEYHVCKLVRTYTIEKSYDEVVEDLKVIKRILPWASKANIAYHVGTGKENKITELLTVI